MSRHIYFRRAVLAAVPFLLNACLPSPAGIPTSSSMLDATTTPAPPQTDSRITLEPSPTQSPLPTQTPTPRPPREAQVRIIPLQASFKLDMAEVSGMTWIGDTLIILPQYPHEYPSSGGTASLFALQKTQILDYLSGSAQEILEPILVPIFNTQVAEAVPGYEGFEAIAASGEQVYLTIEANHMGVMQGYLMQGIFSQADNIITLDPESLAEIPTPVQIFNSAYESLLIAQDQVVALFEANGRELNPDPQGFAIAPAAQVFIPVEMPAIEYRLTDASGVDSEGRFWVINLFMPIEFWFFTASDPIAENFGQGITHAANNHVERLLELKYNHGQVTLSGSPPVQIELIDDSHSRNWEALVRLDDLGFLAMTDTYPDTILAYIPWPE